MLDPLALPLALLVARTLINRSALDGRRKRLESAAAPLPPTPVCVRMLSISRLGEATRCEHGVPDLGWCEPCCAAQRQARLDNGYTIDGEGPRHA